MIVSLRHGVTNSIDGLMLLVGIDNTLVNIVMGIFEPASQCGAKVKVDGVKVSCFRVRTIAFGSYFFVEVGIGGSSGFNWDLACKWVVSWRLIEMTVQTEVYWG